MAHLVRCGTAENCCPVFEGKTAQQCNCENHFVKSVKFFTQIDKRVSVILCGCPEIPIY